MVSASKPARWAFSPFLSEDPGFWLAFGKGAAWACWEHEGQTLHDLLRGEVGDITLSSDIGFQPWTGGSGITATAGTGGATTAGASTGFLQSAYDERTLLIVMSRMSASTAFGVDVFGDRSTNQSILIRADTNNDDIDVSFRTAGGGSVRTVTAAGVFPLGATCAVAARFNRSFDEVFVDGLSAGTATNPQTQVQANASDIFLLNDTDAVGIVVHFIGISARALPDSVLKRWTADPWKPLRRKRRRYIEPAAVIEEAIELAVSASLAAVPALDIFESVALSAGAGIVSDGVSVIEEAIALNASGGVSMGGEGVFEEALALSVASAITTAETIDFEISVSLAAEAALSVVPTLTIEEQIGLAAQIGLAIAGVLVSSAPASKTFLIAATGRVMRIEAVDREMSIGEVRRVIRIEVDE